MWAALKSLFDPAKPPKAADMAEPQTARLVGLHREYASHPSRGLTPAKLARILEQAEQGDLVAQHDLFLDMEEKDAHLYAEISKRRRAILTVPWSVQPPRDANAAEKRQAAEMEALIRDIPNFEDVLLDLMDAVGHGFACLEIEWARAGNLWLPGAITHRPQSWFQLDPETRAELRLRDDSGHGAELRPFGWISHVHRAKSGYIARAGLHRVLAWPYLYKNYSVRDLAEFLEIYGLPLRIGKYPSGASDAEKATLLAAVVGIGHNAAGIMPEGMAIEIQEAAKGSEGPFLAMVRWAESSISKAILGGTLTSQADGKSSTNALGNVHNEVRHDILEADARQVAATLTGTLLHYLVALNLGGADPRRMPRFEFDCSEPEDLALFADALPKLAAAGAQIPVAWVGERLKIPAPKEGEAVLWAPNAGGTPALHAALAAQAPALQDALDDLVDADLAQWEQDLTPLLAPIRAALTNSIEAGETAAQFLERLPGLLADLDADPLADRLTRQAFTARLAGLAGIEP